jgi:glycosyltransferase involved in cell wall biosynthesis
MLVSVYPTEAFMITSYLAHKITGIPLTIYYHDAYVEQQLSKVSKAIAREIEKRILSSSSSLFVLTEYIQAIMKHKGYKSSVIRNIASVPPIERNVREYDPSGLFTIAYSGTIYSNNRDSIERLLLAIRELEGEGIRLRISSPMSKEYLIQQGLEMEELLYFDKVEDLYNFLHCSGLLFLPLAFDSPYPFETKTLLPAKTLEYLALGVPILVHAPRDSYLATYCRRTGFGYLVESPDVDILTDAIRKLRTDLNLRKEILEKAEKLRDRHDPVKISKHFLSLLYKKSTKSVD